MKCPNTLRIHKGSGVQLPAWLLFFPFKISCDRRRYSGWCCWQKSLVLGHQSPLLGSSYTVITYLSLLTDRCLCFVPASGPPSLGQDPGLDGCSIPNCSHSCFILPPCGWIACPPARQSLPTTSPSVTTPSEIKGVTCQTDELS